MTDIPGNLNDVQNRIAEAAKTAGREPYGIELVAVGKAHPQARVLEVLDAGHRVFGENRVQEADEKWPDLKARFPESCLHLIGPLQSNKIKRAVALFDVIETLDREKLARGLAREMDATGRRPDCFIQVNTGEEEQKSGVLPNGLDPFVDYCRDECGLPVVGLMCIPPVDDEPAMHFAFLAELAKRNGLEKLSMGMSHDFETAIRFGATSVRVGSAIFGARPPYPPR